MLPFQATVFLTNEHQLATSSFQGLQSHGFHYTVYRVQILNDYLTVSKTNSKAVLQE